MFKIFELKNKDKTKSIGAHSSTRAIDRNGERIYIIGLMTSAGYFLDPENKDELEDHINKYGTPLNNGSKD